MSEQDTFNTLKYRHVADIDNKYNLPVGTIYWLNDNKELHRENHPAVECPNGTKAWFSNGKCYQVDGPSIMI